MTKETTIIADIRENHEREGAIRASPLGGGGKRGTLSRVLSALTFQRRAYEGSIFIKGYWVTIAQPGELEDERSQPRAKPVIVRAFTGEGATHAFRKIVRTRKP
jgi:hypothetical protein